jgi:hypothetical protein
MANVTLSPKSMATLNLVHKAFIGDVNYYVYAVGTDKSSPEQCVIERGHCRMVPYQVSIQSDLPASIDWIAQQKGSGLRGTW